MTVGAIVAKLRLDMTNFREGMARANSLLEQHGALAMRAGVMLAGFGAAVAGAMAVAVKAASDFEAEMRNVNSILKESEPELAAMSQAVLDMAGKVGQAPAVLARGLYDIASSGFQGADALKVLEASAVAATAGLTDTATASKAITAVLNAYGMGADQVGRVSDVLFKTVERGVVTFGELSQNIGQVVSTAAQAGVPVEELGAAIATMTRAGVQAPEAVTSLNQVLLSFIRPTDAAKEAAEAMGLELTATNLAAKGLSGIMGELGQAVGTSVEELIALEQAGATDAEVMDLVAQRMGLTSEKLSELFPNIRALRGALVLAAGGGEEFSEDVQAMAEATGATAAALAEQSESLRLQWNQTIATLKAGAIEYGSVLLPILKEVTAGLRAGGQVLRALPKPLKTLVVLAATGAAGFAALTAAFIMWQTQMKSAIPLTLQLVGSMKQMIATLATTKVSLTASSLSFAKVGAAAGKAGATIKGIGALVTPVTALAAAALGLGIAYARADDEATELHNKIGKLTARARSLSSQVQGLVAELDSLKPSTITLWSSALGEMFGLKPIEQVQQWRDAVESTTKTVEKAETSARRAKELTEKAEAEVAAVRQARYEQRLAEIEKERQAMLAAGVDAKLAEEWAESQRVLARQEANAAILKLDADLLEAQGKSHQARLKHIEAEVLAWQKSYAEQKGEEEARKAAAEMLQRRLEQLHEELARERAEAFEATTGQIVSSWLGAVDAMRQADRLHAGEHLAQLSKILGFIGKINAARRAAGEAPLFRDEELRLAQQIAGERRRMQDELSAAEERLAEQRRQWTQEELSERRRLHTFELSMIDLTAQHRADLLRLSGMESEDALGQVALEKIEAIDALLEDAELDAESRLAALQEKYESVRRAAEAGMLPKDQAREALETTFAGIREAKEQLAEQERAEFEERRRRHEETVQQIETEQQTLRDQLRETAGSIAESATRVFDGIEQRLQQLSKVKLGAAVAEAGPAAGQRVTNIYLGDRQIAATADVSRLADQLAELLEREIAHARN